MQRGMSGRLHASQKRGSREAAGRSLLQDIFTFSTACQLFSHCWACCGAAHAAFMLQRRGSLLQVHVSAHHVRLLDGSCARASSSCSTEVGVGLPPPEPCACKSRPLPAPLLRGEAAQHLSSPPKSSSSMAWQLSTWACAQHRAIMPCAATFTTLLRAHDVQYSSAHLTSQLHAPSAARLTQGRVGEGGCRTCSAYCFRQALAAFAAASPQSARSAARMAPAASVEGRNSKERSSAWCAPTATIM